MPLKSNISKKLTLTPEWEKCQRPRDEDLVTIHDTIKLLSNKDSFRVASWLEAPVLAFRCLLETHFAEATLAQVKSITQFAQHRTASMTTCVAAMVEKPLVARETCQEACRSDGAQCESHRVVHLKSQFCLRLVLRPLASPLQ